MNLALSFCCLFKSVFGQASPLSATYLGSREGDPSSLVENVSTIHGDYSEIEVDLTVSSPDSLILSRFYSSRDSLQTANFGGWRFNPHCYLTMKKDPKGKFYTTAEGKFEKTYVYVGNPDGTILTYVGWERGTDSSKKSLFKIDPEGEVAGIANTAKGTISCWTNQKNNELYFDSQTNSFELLLCSEGKRFYSKHRFLDNYFITQEVLPSGNKLFYDFDEKGQLSFIKETNASENKILAWIKIEYGNGIHIETSDKKTVEYHFNEDPSGAILLSEVIRSHKPNLYYQYEVVDNQALLTRKTLPEGRFIQIDYHIDKNQEKKVKSVITPVEAKEMTSVLFSYGDNYTIIDGPGERKAIYRFDDDYQLVAIEQYLNGSLYRILKKSWGIKSDAGNLISTSVQDNNGNIFHYKHFTYDSKNRGNIVQEKEYGDIIGLGAISLDVDDCGLVTNQDGEVKNYAYFSGESTHGFFQRDPNGTGVKYWYKKGTNLLLKKFVLTNGSSDSEQENNKSGIKERHFYEYNDDAALIQVTVDDGNQETLTKVSGLTNRTITCISPKKDLPNIGAPEIIEQKYSSKDGQLHFLLKKTVNQFDNQGNIAYQAIYDEDENYCYTLTKEYKCGLLAFETDPLGGETHYSYDANQNLIKKTHSNTGITFVYCYNLKNLLVSSLQKDYAENQFATYINYDPAGNKLSEIDRYGNETIYINDSLGRPTQIIYPETSKDRNSSLKPIYTYTYDIFDNPISVKDPKGRTLESSYNIRGKPIKINHLNGTKEIFKYDSGGNLHLYYGVDGILQVFSYDYKGRVNKLDYFPRNGKINSYPFKKTSCVYGTFHKMSEINENGAETTYAYNQAQRLASISTNKKKIEFLYDSLGRTHGVKHWKSAETFTLDLKEHDFLDRVIEERTQDQTGKILLKKRYVYNCAGQLAQIIGYPQNKECVLIQYEYDGFGRLCKTTNGAEHISTIEYDDTYINKWGQRTYKLTLIDPLNNRTEEIFDIAGWLVQSTRKDKSGEILMDSEFYYDSLGNQIGQKSLVLSADATSSSYETELTQNLADQVESYTLGKGTKEERTLKYEYNSYGDIAAKYNHDSKEAITYSYDNHATLSCISYKAGNNKIDCTLSYYPYNNSKEVYLSSSLTSISFFDTQNSPIAEEIKDSFGSYKVMWSYDGEGKINKLYLPDNSFIEYFYEGPFIKGAKRFNKDKKELYSYQVVARDLMGNILEEILPGHLGERKQTWDEAGRRIEISTDFFQDRILKNGYDPLNNIKKRETVLKDEAYAHDYDYNALGQLIVEQGEIKHAYSYDSIGNRLQRDTSVYKVNDLNHLVEAEEATYTFDANGNLAFKTIGTKTWIYKSNHLNQIVSITDPDKNVIKFNYDLSGKRLSKCIESKGKKSKIFRFFYLGNSEIGCLDENGLITELKAPANPNQPETGSFAIEIKKEIYVPLYDLQGNIICLLDHQRRKILETYHYSTFGEEMIFNKMGRAISNSSVGNNWRYLGKRIDKEINLMYFGYRYYDPEVGRWISPDPAGNIDGPNLYVYSRNNPMKYVDYFGLSSTFNETCGCTQHGHPGWHNAPAGCVCICGKNGIYAEESYQSIKGSSIKSSMCGVGHGVVDFVVGSIYDLQVAVTYMGAVELELSFEERNHIIEAVELSQSSQMATVENWLMNTLSISKSDAVYYSLRSMTSTGLELGSLIAGGYRAIKGVLAFNGLTKAPIQAFKLAKKFSSLERKGISVAGTRRAQLGYAPFQTVRNETTIINNRTYIGHALDRMQDRGFMPSAVENAIKTGKVSPTGIPGRVKYYDPVNNLSVIVQDNQRIISVIPERSTL